MRILAIRGKNLASLRGEFELRLDHARKTSSECWTLRHPQSKSKTR